MVSDIYSLSAALVVVDAERTVNHKTYAAASRMRELALVAIAEALPRRTGLQREPRQWR